MSPNEPFFELYRRKALVAARRSLAITASAVFQQGMGNKQPRARHPAQRHSRSAWRYNITLYGNANLDYEEHPPVGIRLHSYRNCPLDVWRFSPTRQYLICHRSGRLGDRVG